MTDPEKIQALSEALNSPVVTIGATFLWTAACGIASWILWKTGKHQKDVDRIKEEADTAIAAKEEECKRRVAAAEQKAFDKGVELFHYKMALKRRDEWIGILYKIIIGMCGNKARLLQGAMFTEKQLAELRSESQKRGAA